MELGPWTIDSLDLYGDENKNIISNFQKPVIQKAEYKDRWGSIKFLWLLVILHYNIWPDNFIEDIQIYLVKP